jgi:hypothetical protein
MTYLNDASNNLTIDHLQSKILIGSRIKRESFDPENKDHLKSYLKYINSGNWGEVHFFSEAPFVTVPATVNHRYALHTLKEKLIK